MIHLWRSVLTTVLALSLAAKMAQADVPACAQPILPAGQEAAIAKLFRPVAMPAGVTAGDVHVLADRIVGVWQWQPTGKGAQPQRRVYILHIKKFKPLADAAAGAQPMQTSQFEVQLAAPCWAHGPVQRPDEPVLAALGVPAAQTATCQDDAQTQRIDKALWESIRAGESAVRLQCPDAAGQGGQPGQGSQAADGARDLGAALRRVDEALRVGDVDASQRALDAVVAQYKPESLNLTGQFDMGIALMRRERKALAAPILQGALTAMRTRWPADPPTTAADHGEWLQVTERAAAAHAWLGDVAQARAVLEHCWQVAATQPSGAGSCTALPLADALVVTGQAKVAEALLDAQLKRVAKPPVAWYAARIGLASRQEDGRTELATAEAAVKAWPDELTLQDALATACFRAGEHLRAVRILEQVFRKDPKFPGVLGRMSGVMNDWGRVDPPREGQISGWQQLRDEVKARAEKDPNDIPAQFLHGVSLFYSAEFEPALAQMKKAEPFAPNEGRVFIYQAMSNLWLGRKDVAEALVHKAIAANPQDPDVYYCLSQVVRFRDTAAAAKALERYLEIEGRPGALHFAKKTARVQAELDLLRKGQIPPLWDKPGHYDDADQPDKAPQQVQLPAGATETGAPRRSPLQPSMKQWLWVGIGALIFIGGGVWLTRNVK